MIWVILATIGIVGIFATFVVLAGWIILLQIAVMFALIALIIGLLFVVNKAVDYLEDKFRK